MVGWVVDPNKRQKLHEIGYEIPKVCGLCKHGKFRPSNDFGDCQLHTYVHQKHTAENKPLSILKFGTCPSFEADLEKIDFIHAFETFLLP